MNYDLRLLGISEEELATLLDPGVKQGLRDPDEVPKPPAEPITSHGKPKNVARSLRENRKQSSTACCMPWFGQVARVLLPGHAAYIWVGYANCANYKPALAACKPYFSQDIVWGKQRLLLTGNDRMRGLPERVGFALEPRKIVAR